MPKIVDHDEARRTIAEAARDVVLREGLHAATVKKIAAAAGFSPSLGLYYFDGRDSILLFAFEDYARRELDRLREALDAAPTAPEMLEVAIRMLVTEAGSEERSRILLEYAGSPLRGIDEVHDEILSAYHELLTAMFVQVEQAGFDLPLQPQHEASFLLALSDGSVLMSQSAPSRRELFQAGLHRELERRYGIDLAVDSPLAVTAGEVGS